MSTNNLKSSWALAPFTLNTLVLILATVGHVFFHVGAYGCITFQQNHNDILTNVGYFTFKDSDGRCTSLDDSVDLERDFFFKLGRAVAVGGGILSWFVLVALYLQPCFSSLHSKSIFLATKGAMFVLVILSLLLLVGKGSYYIGLGGFLAVAASFAWATAGLGTTQRDAESDIEPDTPKTDDIESGRDM